MNKNVTVVRNKLGQTMRTSASQICQGAPSPPRNLLSSAPEGPRRVEIFIEQCSKSLVLELLWTLPSNFSEILNNSNYNRKLLFILVSVVIFYYHWNYWINTLHKKLPET